MKINRINCFRRQAFNLPRCWFNRYLNVLEKIATIFCWYDELFICDRFALKTLSFLRNVGNNDLFKLFICACYAKWNVYLLECLSAQDILWISGRYGYLHTGLRFCTGWAAALTKLLDRSRLTTVLVGSKSWLSSELNLSNRSTRRPPSGATENASTENESTGGWNMQVRNT